ncbi:family 43 glycosylhydrolase [Saccharicrinis sp. FJH54]|uniref:family 43 glycosylhydrolase n=1 Tax=Saccharicrinis sp. FJH54 TaxID=3344665 RepID=UPI0035D432BF
MKTFLAILLISCSVQTVFSQPEMHYGDDSRLGVPFSKDPHVIKFQGRYLMYTSAPGVTSGSEMKGWGIGVAESNNLIDWVKLGEIDPVGTLEQKGICAPCALVVNDTVHLFYQTYGNWKEDAICHAWSTDGLHFTRNETNPVFRPTGEWNCGRAIDAEVYRFNNRYYLYFATRDPSMKTQFMGVATSPLNGRFKRETWSQQCAQPILKPEYPWEGFCTEGASVIQKGDDLYMFYAGAYNNQPQQIGVARSRDGFKWEKLSSKPFLCNGDPGSWNSSESGHPHIFEDVDGKTYLFYQGNNDSGKTWFISYVPVFWRNNKPYIK